MKSAHWKFLLLALAVFGPCLSAQEKEYVRLAAISLDADPKERSLPKLLEWISQAGREHASLVCFPRNSVATEPETIPGPITQAVVARAKEAGVDVVANIREKDGDKIFQTSFVCDRKGTLLGKYRQTHRMPDEHFELGNDLPLFHMDYGTLALKSGSDHYFPELDRVYAFKGASLVIWSADPEAVEDEHTSEAAFRGRAVSNGIYFICARQSGVKNEYDFQPNHVEGQFAGTPLGRSLIVDRFGNSLAETSYAGGMALAAQPLDRWRNVGSGPREAHKKGVFALLSQPDFRTPPPLKIEPAKRKVRVCVLDGSPGGGRGPIDDVLARLDEVGKAGTDVACLYEYEWILKRDAAQEAEGKRRLAQIAEKAKQWNMYVVLAGVVDSREHNDGILIGRDGKEVGRYHKIERTHPEQILGTEVPVFDTDFGRVAMRICADEWCPEIDRSAALQGAEILFNPTMSHSPSADFRERREMGRAIDNGFWIVSATHGMSQSNQRSFVLDPEGVFVARGEYWKTGILRTVIDLDNKPYRFWREGDGSPSSNKSVQKSRDLRETIFSMRRPELYKELSPKGAH